MQIWRTQPLIGSLFLKQSPGGRESPPEFHFFLINQYTRGEVITPEHQSSFVIRVFDPMRPKCYVFSDQCDDHGAGERLLLKDYRVSSIPNSPHNRNHGEGA
jgi:hypothetical protein